MTYKELAEVILGNPKQWNRKVTVFDNYEGQYYFTSGYDFSIIGYVDDTALKDDHLIICF